VAKIKAMMPADRIMVMDRTTTIIDSMHHFGFRNFTGEWYVTDNSTFSGDYNILDVPSGGFPYMTFNQSSPFSTGTVGILQ
jgi:hypothetical protein